MGKTRDDEAYESGVKAGRSGGFIDDISQSLFKTSPLNFTKRDEIYNKGYEWGVAHRYDTSRDTSRESPISSGGSESSISYGDSYSDDGGSSYVSSDDYGDSYSEDIGSSYVSGDDGSCLACIGTIIAPLFVLSFLYSIYGYVKKGWPLPWEMSVSTSKNISQTGGDEVAIQTSQTSPQLVGMYLWRVKNYNPDEWRVTPKTVSHTFDGGKSWLIVWSIRKYTGLTIHCLEARDRRSETEILPQGERDLILIIDRSALN